MSFGVYHDVEYVSQIAYRLERFRQQDRLKWNFRCPYCGDSEKSRLKARGFLREGKKGLYFYCYNCDKNASFAEFLKFLDSSLHEQYQKDKYSPSKKFRDHTEDNLEEFDLDIEVRFAKKEPKKEIKKTKHIISVKSLDEDHFALGYLKERKIPKKSWKRIYFSSKLQMLIDPQRYRHPEPRVVFPCCTSEGDHFAYSGRILPDYDGIRYKVARLDSNLPLVFGIEKMDPDELVYVVEGPIDSFFLPNCIAACCSNLSSIPEILSSHEVAVPSEMVLVYDNERRNKYIVRRMLKAIDLGFKVCIWPDWIKPKDINAMVLAGLDPLEIIVENTFSGLLARNKIAQWKRCDPNKLGKD